jgi:hypothetical protein
VKLAKPPPVNEVFLGYATHPDIGKVVRRRKGATKYNTQLDNGFGTMQLCCKCFSRASSGACSGHNSEMYVRLLAAEAVLKEADKRVAALEAAQGDPDALHKALAEVVALRHVPEADLRPKARVP